jgi:hypothetical protein
MFNKEPRLFVAMLEAGDRKTPDMVTYNVNRACKYGVDKGYFRIEKDMVLGGISLVSGARNIMTQDFLKTKATHLLWIDNDMLIIRPDAIAKLVSKKKDMICGVYTSRQLPLRLVFRTNADRKNDFSDEYAKIKKGEPFIVETAGFGLMLVSRACIETVYDYVKKNEPTGMPYQPFVYKEEYQGEDGAFTLRAKFCDIDTWVDPTVLIGHFGLYPFTIIDWLDYYEQKQGIRKVTRFDSEEYLNDKSGIP